MEMEPDLNGEWIDLDQLCELTGYAEARQRKLLATDPDAPPRTWITGKTTGSGQWMYPLAESQAYADVITARRTSIDYEGDPADELDWKASAAAWRVAEATFRRYVYRSRPRWVAGETGTVPFPSNLDSAADLDHVPFRDWRWTAQDLGSFPRPHKGSRRT